MKVHQFVFDGIGTAKKTSKIVDHAAKQVERNLGQVGVEVITEWADWPASMLGTIGGKHSWEEASRIAEAWMDARIATIPEDEEVIILAYSGGNLPARNWIKNNPRQLHRIAAVGLASDPWRPEGAQQNGMEKLSGYGICGQEPAPIPGRTFWVGVVGDDITATPHDCLLRTPADNSRGFPAQVLENLVPNLQKGNFQLAWQMKIIQKDPIGYLIGLGGRLDYARQAIFRYGSGFHTDHYRDPYKQGLSPMARLGDTIAYKVKKDNGLFNAV